MARPRIPVRRPPPRKQSNISDVSDRAVAIENEGNLAGAIQTYRDWLATSAKLDHAWMGLYNLGILLTKADDLAGAKETYTDCLKKNPTYVPALVNIGRIHEREGQFDDALDCWKTGLSILDKSPNPDQALLAIVLSNRGRLFDLLKRFPEALEMYTRCLRLEPNNRQLLYHWVYVRQNLCEWPIYTEFPGITRQQMIDASSPLATLAATDDPAVQLQAAIRHRVAAPSTDIQRLSPIAGYSHTRLRIGYLSSNFSAHPVSVLTAELYELHDRSRFEIFAFCWSPEDNSLLRARVRKGVDHFIRINEMSDEEAAHAIRDAEIDILIDLQGQTAGARSIILAYRPAPVQITYLGFPATSAVPEIDYILADRYVIPEESAQFFTEKPLYLPDCFQVNDRHRDATKPKSRSDYGLPESAFVFCSFNKNTKFNPELFSGWMSILLHTPNSVLWLLAADARTRENLIKHAGEHGISSERLVFAPRVPIPDYMAQYEVADLFLDLWPFNGGTTVADALWMDLPVLTLSGRSFASRMGGSLLHAIGLPELITTSLEDYEALAIDLGNSPERLRQIKTRLIENKTTYPLFDTPKFTRNLEDIFERVALHPAPASAARPSTFPSAQIHPGMFSEREIFFVVDAPAFHKTNSVSYAMHAMAEDMYLMGCNVGMLAGAGMPGARVPLITPDYLDNLRSAGMMIVAVYPEIIAENVLNADYCVWWLLNSPELIKNNWNGNYDWADRVVGFAPESAPGHKCDAILSFPHYDPDFFFPNENVPKTETTYYVDRIFGVTDAIQTPVPPTYILNPANNLSYRQLRQILWHSKVVISSEWSETLIIARLCGTPVIHLPSPLLSMNAHNTDEHMLGAAWGYSEQNVETASQSIGNLHPIYQKRKAEWLPCLTSEINAWISGVKKK